MMHNDDLQRVTDEVNALPYVADASRYRTPEFWAQIDADGGDCEDYAIGKLHRLLALGWPIERMRLACCYAEPIEGQAQSARYHCVLWVRDTDGHERVLDNRFHYPLPIADLLRIGYAPDVIQTAGGAREWKEWRWKPEA